MTGERMAAIDILLVEDNKGDVRQVQRTVEDREIDCDLSVAQTGDEALDRLYQRGEFAETPRPDLVLLDLNLPATSGQSVLQTLKSDSHLKQIPVVVLTSTQSEDELNSAYSEHANACLIKPVDPVEFADRIETVVAFWGRTVTLPNVSEPGDEIEL